MGDDRVDDRLRDRIEVVIAHGSPERLLRDYVEDQHVDLTLIRSHGSGALFDALIGSTAKTLLETLEGDLLIVHYRAQGIGQRPVCKRQIIGEDK